MFSSNAPLARSPEAASILSRVSTEIPPSAYFAYFAVQIFRVARYGGLGQFKCFSKNSKVPTPLIVCGPLKNSMAARSPMPSVS